MVTCAHFQSLLELAAFAQAQSEVVKLQGKLRKASNPEEGGIYLEQKGTVQTLLPGPLTATALRSGPTHLRPRVQTRPFCALPLAPSWVVS